LGPKDQLPNVKPQPSVIRHPKRANSRRKKCRRRQRKCWDKHRKKPDFSRVKLVVKMTNNPTERSVNTSALKEEDASTNHKQAALQLSSAVKMDERQIAIATLFSLLLWSLMKNVI